MLMRAFPPLTSPFLPLHVSCFALMVSLCLSSNPEGPQHCRDEIPQKELLSLMLRHQMEQDRAMLLRGGCWRCQPAAAAAEAAGMNDLSKPCGCEASGEETVLLLCGSRDAASALFPGVLFPLLRCIA